MQRLACCALLLAFACGDAPSSPEPLTVVANVVIDQSPGDSVPPVTVFPDSLAVEVTNSSGDPIGGALVNFQTDPDGCVSSDVQSLQTNTDGRVFFQVTAGEDAVTSTGPCTVRTIRSREGRADVADSIDVAVLPGPYDAMGSLGNTSTSEPDTLFMTAGWGPKDEYGNPLAWRVVADSFMHAASRNPWNDLSRALVHDSVGTANVAVVHGDSTLCRVPVEARSDGQVDLQMGGDCQSM